ncbi:transglutaminase domain-containing protein [Longibaculum muris]|uniref:transglutaminase domain-containing protein n=1 Tax=Longibaculum muris TaxID=1796628 RepID=UPI0022E2F359|nr:transglutaminase domain-containing protein [Longibaculum muris]
MGEKKHSILKKVLILIFSAVIGITIGVVGISYWNDVQLETQNDLIDEIYAKDKHYQYYYSKLNAKDKDTYKRMYFAMATFKDEIDVKETNTEQITVILNYIFNDHPELYYIDGEYEYVKETDTLTFYPRFVMNKKEVESKNSQLKEITAEVVEKAKRQKDDLTKAKVIYDYIIENTKYVERKGKDQDVIGALLEHETVCAGYARAYQLLMNQVGVPCSYIVGDSKIETENSPGYEGHAWNMVKINDDYYYCDPTWGDDANKYGAHTCYAYFMMDSDDMLRCYTTDDFYEKTKNPSVSYFKDNHIYMESYNENIVSNAIQLGLKNKSRVAEVKCGSQSVYNRLKKRLTKDYLAYEQLKKNGCWSDNTRYACLDELKVIELYY